MKQGLIGMLGTVCVVFACTACGTGKGPVSGGAKISQVDASVCLEGFGAAIAIVAVDSRSKMVEARLPDDDLILVGRLPSPDVAGRSIRAIKESRRAAGLGGIVIASTVDHGSVLVVTIGHAGFDGGLPSTMSEQLARSCAIRSEGRTKREPTLPDTTEAAQPINRSAEKLNSYF